ncbi:MAG: hypothetical protein JW395_3027 [Nitrospira sp.]|nr:hypothetical protein [Nitrospira sp.]
MTTSRSLGSVLGGLANPSRTLYRIRGRVPDDCWLTRRDLAPHAEAINHAQWLMREAFFENLALLRPAIEQSLAIIGDRIAADPDKKQLESYDWLMEADRLSKLTSFLEEVLLGLERLEAPVFDIRSMLANPDVGVDLARRAVLDELERLERLDVPNDDTPDTRQSFFDAGRPNWSFRFADDAAMAAYQRLGDSELTAAIRAVDLALQKFYREDHRSTMKLEYVHVFATRLKTRLTGIAAWAARQPNPTEGLRGALWLEAITIRLDEAKGAITKLDVPLSELTRQDLIYVLLSPNTDTGAHQEPVHTTLRRNFEVMGREHERVWEGVKLGLGVLVGVKPDG